MSLFAIAKICSNNEIVGMRLFDTETKATKDIPINSLKAGLAKGVKVENLELVNGEIKGVNGNLDRYSIVDVSGNLLNDSAFIIISKIEDKGYTVVDYKGIAKNFRTDDILRLVNERGLKIANGKIVPKDSEQIISAINGEYQVQKLEDLKPKDKENKVERVKYLVELLNRARKAYEQENREIISNYEYDKLYDELEALEKETGVILNNSPTQNVGYEVVSSIPKEKHEVPMLSLDKTKEIDRLKEFLGDKIGVLSWKLDGLTVVLHYNNGKLVKAVTRGNGEIGEVVTPNAKQFKNIPLEIPLKEPVVVRGEAIIKYSDFERINNAIPDVKAKFKNPRNLCSGSVRQLDSSVTARRNVMFYAFALVDSAGYSSNSYHKNLIFLSSLGFDTVERELVTRNNVEDVVKRFERKVETFDIPTDGLVLTYDDIAYGQSLGRTAKFPRHSVAFKWGDEVAETTLLEIEWSPSRTGLINPIAIFEPVELEGTTVTRASVHNVSILRDLELGIGDRILVYKANMIIPQISDNLTRSGTCEIPDFCPVCGYETSIHIEEDSEVETLYCDNPFCPAKDLRKMVHFVSRDAMNIEGLSEARLQRFIEEGFIRTYADIYRLGDYELDIVNMDGFGQKSFDRLMSAIGKSRDVRLANLIYALGIPYVGLATAKLIAKKCNYDIHNLAKLTYADLVGIEGIGETIAESFIDWMNNKENVESLVELLKDVRIVKEQTNTDNSLQGLVFCCTGAVYMFKNRDELKEYIESRGGKMTGSVTKNTSYLITNDTTTGSRKNREAQKLGVPVISEQEFIDMFVKK